MSELTSMANIGKEMAKKLTAIGINSPEKLLQSGSKQVFLKLKEKYPYIKRVKYNAPHECAFTSKEDALKFADTYMNVMHEQAEFQYFEKVIDSDRAYHANKKAYVIRNQEMIDASDICIFYYNESYQPPLRKNSKKDYTSYQPKSGTGIAFAYAKQKKKKIINLFE